MLPESRQTDFLYDIPLLTVEKDEVENFVEELKEFHGQFEECYSRSEPQENLFRYLVGRLSSLERKTIEPIAVHTKGVQGVRAMLRSVSEILWDEKKARSIYHERVSTELGEAEGVLMFDESGFVKKGEHSAGVGRQYCAGI
jgi:SRSO17 transposase